MYIITIQKTHLYGISVLKELPVERLCIFWQIFILSTLGISLAVLALLGTQLTLPASVPFYSDWQPWRTDCLDCSHVTGWRTLVHS